MSDSLQLIQRPSTARAWLLAMRPKTLTASLTPVIVGTALAWRLQGSVSFEIAALTAMMALLIQIGINLVNDALDFRNGVDTKERIGFPRACQQGWLPYQHVLIGGGIAFAAALVIALLLTMHAGGAVLAIALVCVSLGYLYTGGPFSLASLGLSDPAVLIFFGIVATTTTVYIQTLTWAPASFLAGLQIGLLATAISAINNLRDIVQDRSAGKKTLPVRFGIEMARIEIATLLIFPYALGVYWWEGEGMLGAFLLPLLTLPFALKIIYSVMTTPPNALYNGFLAQTAGLLLLFGLLLCGGLSL